MSIVIHLSDKSLFSLLPTHGLLQHDSRLTSPPCLYMRFAMQVTQIQQLSFLQSAISFTQSFPHPTHPYSLKTNEVKGRVTIYLHSPFSPLPRLDSNPGLQLAERMAHQCAISLLFKQARRRFMIEFNFFKLFLRYCLIFN